MSNPEYIRYDYEHSLAHAIEEAGDLIAALGKTSRWGPYSVNPELPPTQQERNIDWVFRE
jgi:hypothetical protein